jgi:hypothetical protein
MTTRVHHFPLKSADAVPLTERMDRRHGAFRPAKELKETM